MSFTNSPLVQYTKISPNKNVNRNNKIDRISIHIVVGQCSIEALGDHFANYSIQASSNYGIGYDGKIGMFVEEKDRSWCTSSSSNDNRAVTIECASDTQYPYAINDEVYESLIKLCVDICERNGKKKLLWLEDKDTTLNYKPADDEMVITVHRWFANKSCPGDYVYDRLGQIASKVTAELGGSTEIYRVRKSWEDAASQIGAWRNLEAAKEQADANPGYKVFDEDGKCVYEPEVDESFTVEIKISNLNIRKGPGTNYATTGKYTGKGIFTIVDTEAGKGSTAGWGKLKSGAGWISLDYATKL